MKQIKSNVDAYDVSVAITGMNGTEASIPTRPTVPVTAEELRNNLITARSAAQPTRLMYQLDTDLLRQQMNNTGQKPTPYIIASRAFMERTSGTLYGMIYIAIREPEFRRFYNNFTSNGNDVLILDKSGLIVSSNRQDLIGQHSRELLGYATKINEQGLNYINANVMNKESILLSNYIPSYDFYLVNMIDRQTAIGQIIDVKSVVLICIGIVLIALLIVFLISRRLIRSLTRLVKQMSTVREKNFDNYLPVTGSYEVRQLSHAYNYMLDELNDYIRKLLETQKGQRNAELAALQRQINPHFLYNTLASIKMLVLKGNKETAAETINALISLLQNTISNVSETITIEQEMVPTCKIMCSLTMFATVSEYR